MKMDRRSAATEGRMDAGKTTMDWIPTFAGMTMA